MHYEFWFIITIHLYILRTLYYFSSSCLTPYLFYPLASIRLAPSWWPGCPLWGSPPARPQPSRWVLHLLLVRAASHSQWPLQCGWTRRLRSIHSWPRSRRSWGHVARPEPGPARSRWLCQGDRTCWPRAPWLHFGWHVSRSVWASWRCCWMSAGQCSHTLEWCPWHPCSKSAWSCGTALAPRYPRPGAWPVYLRHWFFWSWNRYLSTQNCSIHTSLLTVSNEQVEA